MPLHWLIAKQCELSRLAEAESVALARASNYIVLLTRWRWLGRLKQSDGGFSVTEGGEEDVR
jgi:protein farnesyltransferase subunit beta